MTACRSCQRPIAAGRSSCLYCGAPVPAEPLTATAGAEPAAEPEAARSTAVARSLLLIEPRGCAAEVLASALGCSTYDAALAVKRGGLQLHRLLEPGAIEVEAARLRAAGIATTVVPETELQLRPMPALRGERQPGRLVLHGAGGLLEIRPADLLLIVTGPITRQRQASPERRKVDTGLLVPGWRAHLHRSSDPRPIELDPDNLEPGFAASGSTRLEIDAWVAELAAAGIPRDDGFRDQPPALSPAEAEPTSRLSALGALPALARGPALDPREATKPGRHKPVAPVVLDNLKQFRFYSAWHAAVERRRREAC